MYILCFLSYSQILVDFHPVDLSTHSLSEFTYVVYVGKVFNFVGFFPHTNPFFCLFTCEVHSLPIGFVTFQSEITNVPSRVVRMPVSANPRLKVTGLFIFLSKNVFHGSRFELSQAQN